MNKNFLKENYNDSPSIRRLRKRVFISQVSIQSHIASNTTTTTTTASTTATASLTSEHGRKTVSKSTATASFSTAGMPTYDAMRQLINGVRRNVAGFGSNAIDLSSIVIPDNLKYCYKAKEEDPDVLFYWDDSGEDDESRVIVFSTEDNFKILSENRDWFSDGTFDISPTLFTQLYSIHVIVNNKDLPLVYGYLPNKEEKTYVKFFNMVKKSITIMPISFNVDFEKAVFNAAYRVFNSNI